MASNYCLNDLLYYVNFRRKIAPVNDVVSTCEAFYTAEVVLHAKKEFFDAIGERDGLRFVNRRGKSGENPAKCNLEDLVNAMNKCDNDGIELPTFTSSDYTKVPHNDAGNVSMNQLLNLIHGMRQQLSSLEKRLDSSSVTSADSSSSTSERTPSPPPTMTTTASLPAAPSLPPPPPPTASLAAAPSLPISASSAAPIPVSTAPSFAAAASASSVPTAATGVITQDVLSSALKTAIASSATKKKKDEKQVSRSAEARVMTSHVRNRNIVIGKKPSSGVMTWGGAPLTIDCYVGRVDISVTKDQIKSDVVAMGIDVVDIDENKTRHGLFKSFKLVIKKVDYEKLNVPEVWPEGVVFRRFRRPRPPVSGQVDDPQT